MGFNDIMLKLRQWDNRSAQWFTRHFYLLFFEFLLVFVFVLFFINTIDVINVGWDIKKNSVLEQLLLAQSFNTLIIVFLMLLNSFWMLYIFNSLIRLRAILKNVDYNLSKRRYDRRDNSEP